MKLNIPLNPALAENHLIWKRIKSLVEDNEKDYQKETFCKKFPNEPLAVYRSRRSIFADGFINPTIELITAPGHTIYSKDIKIDLGASENTRLSNFLYDCTRGGNVPLVDFMRENVCSAQRCNGTTFTLVDMPQISDGQSEAEQVETRVWPYVTMIDPLDVLNFVIANGEIVKFAYKVKSDSISDNPLDWQNAEKKQIRIWTKTEYITATDRGGDYDITSVPNRWGFVPVIIQASFKPTTEAIIGEAPFFASSRQIITANNMVHIVNMELMKHANSMLLIHKESLSAHNSTQDKSGQFRLKTIPEDNAFIWNGGFQYHAPSYLVRDLGIIPHCLEQYRQYMSAAFGNEKSAKSVQKEGYGGDDAAKSGFALLVERDPIMANIQATAMDMQSIHRRVLEMADAMINDGRRDSEIVCEYDMNYDLKAFSTMLDDTKKLVTEINIPSETVMREQYKQVAARVISDPDTLQQAITEIEEHDYGAEKEADSQIQDEINAAFKQPEPKSNAGATNAGATE